MIDLLLAAASGLLLLFAFPKFGQYYLVYVALVPLLVAIRRSRSEITSAFLGIVCGSIFIGGTVFWITILSKWAGSWADLAWVVLAIFQGIFIAAFAAAYKFSLKRWRNLAILTCPFIWVVVEWIRSLGPYGVTGGGLAYSQADFLPVIQMARYTGVYGVSFLIVLVNESLVEAWFEKKWKHALVSILLLVSAVAFGYHRIGSFRETGTPIKVAVIQPNISQDVKLDFGLAYDIVSVHESMSRASLPDKPQVIIWPETAVTTYLFETNTIRNGILKLVRDSRVVYMIGTPFRERDRIYNSVVAFSPKGEVMGRYDKQRLVPFGEYLPLRPLFNRLLGDNPLFAEDYNGNPHPVLIDTGIAKVGVVVCFESTFPYIVRDKVKKGAQFILVTTNDAWFFDSAAVYQHLQAARMRAVENNIYVVQAANTGISAIIDPVGRIIKRSMVEQPAVLIGTVYVH